jgi:hypothetical protein
MTEYGFHGYLKRRRKLTNLRIDEVSSVDRGAGVGVRAVLLKRQQENDMSVEALLKSMPGAGAIGLAEAAYQDRCAGKISDARYASICKSMAQSMHPSATSEGAALAQFYKTAVGQIFLRPTPRLDENQHEALLKAESLSSVEYGRDSNRPQNYSERRSMAGATDGFDPAEALKTLAQSIAARDKCSLSKGYDTAMQSELGQKLMRLDKQRSGLTV